MIALYVSDGLNVASAISKLIYVGLSNFKAHFHKLNTRMISGIFVSGRLLRDSDTVVNRCCHVSLLRPVMGVEIIYSVHRPALHTVLSISIH